MTISLSFGPSAKAVRSSCRDRLHPRDLTEHPVVDRGSSLQSTRRDFSPRAACGRAACSGPDRPITQSGCADGQHASRNLLSVQKSIAQDGKLGKLSMLGKSGPAAECERVHRDYESVVRPSHLGIWVRSSAASSALPSASRHVARARLYLFTTPCFMPSA